MDAGAAARRMAAVPATAKRCGARENRMDATAQVEQLFPTFLQYGAVGILALAFLVLLVIQVRADRRAQLYADRLAEASFDRTR